MENSIEVVLKGVSYPIKKGLRNLMNECKALEENYCLYDGNGTRERIAAKLLNSESDNDDQLSLELQDEERTVLVVDIDDQLCGLGSFELPKDYEGNKAGDTLFLVPFYSDGETNVYEMLNLKTESLGLFI